jgi:hypothetical protein
MIRSVLESIDGVATYPVISLVLFVLAFAGVVIWALRLDRGLIETMRRLPLDNETVPEGDKVDG